ncbi:uncharacterized protein [Dermacentor albipictus]|uniref:uncharacterized protein isoform X2 n=1 Tax=Dermacentor albipictus TaxID=60249 RepID=UPI0031FD06C9
MFLFIYLYIIHTRLPTYPHHNYTGQSRLTKRAMRLGIPLPGHVGSSCDVSSQCLDEADCVRGVCPCDTDAFRVVAGACISVPDTSTVSTITNSSASHELRPLLRGDGQDHIDGQEGHITNTCVVTSQ